jgi:hypothetical protein
VRHNFQGVFMGSSCVGEKGYAGGYIGVEATLQEEAMRHPPHFFNHIGLK